MELKAEGKNLKAFALFNCVPENTLVFSEINASMRSWLIVQVSGDSGSDWLQQQESPGLFCKVYSFLSDRLTLRGKAISISMRKTHFLCSFLYFIFFLGTANSPSGWGWEEGMDEAVNQQCPFFLLPPPPHKTFQPLNLSLSSGGKVPVLNPCPSTLWVFLPVLI